MYVSNYLYISQLLVKKKKERMRRNRNLKQRAGGFLASRKYKFRYILYTLAFFAIVPPVFFHFRLKHFQKMQIKKCSWLSSPPLVCAHGGDSSRAFPNTMAAYHLALSSRVDCIEIDVSRSSDGVLFALHDRDLQRISGNSTSRVGYMTMKEIKELVPDDPAELEFHDNKIPTIEDALKLVSSSVRQIVLDAKVGPPSYEKGLAKDILNIVEKTRCKNCLVWAKSDNLAREVMRLSSDVVVGYIVMKDPSTGARTNLLRISGAGVVGVYHQLVDKNLVKVLHGRSKKVFAWTVDDTSAMQKMLYENVDAIVTGNFTLLQRLMQDMRTQCLEEGFSFSRGDFND